MNLDKRIIFLVRMEQNHKFVYTLRKINTFMLKCKTIFSSSNKDILKQKCLILNNEATKRNNSAEYKKF